MCLDDLSSRILSVVPPDATAYVSMLATTVNDEEPQLLPQEIARETVATIEDALVVIR